MKFSYRIENENEPLFKFHKTASPEVDMSDEDMLNAEENERAMQWEWEAE
jgi:hypothetical protein